MEHCDSIFNIPLLDPKIRVQRRRDGSVRVKSTIRLEKPPHRMTARLEHWAAQTPDRVFLAQRTADRKNWDTCTYREAYEAVRSLAQFLIDSPVTPEYPLLILSENSVEHGLIALAALHAGLPLSCIAPAYSLRSTDFAKLRHVVGLLSPGLIFAQHVSDYEQALTAAAPGIAVLGVTGLRPTDFSFEEALKTAPTRAVEKAFSGIKPATVAKIMFTSGSTGLPKGVMNTHGNITTNWQQITQTFPFFQNGGLTLIDWLPWNHTFGGNHNFGLTLFNGGSLYIDDGNPTPAGLQRTLDNLRDIAPSVYFNVPKGFEALLPVLRTDEALQRHFFSRLNMFFYAGAGMAQHVWDEMEAVSKVATGKRLFIGSGLGMTEACPSALFNTRFDAKTGMIGLPVPGLELKLVPDGDKMEARFKGNNLTPGYWRNSEATAAAFDEDGFYKTGDALTWVDADDPAKGLRFDGRIAEDFKLDSGTWVNAGVLRAKLIAAGGGLIQDAVITGHDRAWVGAIVFPELHYCRRIAGLGPEAGLAEIIRAPQVAEALQQVVEAFARESTGTSTLIKKAVFADFELSFDLGEITDKGSINQRAVLANHQEIVDALYA